MLPLAASMLTGDYRAAITQNSGGWFLEVGEGKARPPNRLVRLAQINQAAKAGYESVPELSAVKTNRWGELIMGTEKLQRDE